LPEVLSERIEIYVQEWIRKHPEVDIGRIGIVDFVPGFVESKIYDKVFKSLALLLLNKGVSQDFLMERFNIDNIRPFDNTVVSRTKTFINNWYAAHPKMHLEGTLLFGPKFETGLDMKLLKKLLAIILALLGELHFTYNDWEFSLDLESTLTDPGFVDLPETMYNMIWDAGDDEKQSTLDVILDRIMHLLFDMLAQNVSISFMGIKLSLNVHQFDGLEVE